MYNLDGSQGAICGNGIRCVAKYVYDYGLTDKTSVSVETLAGIKYLDFVIKDGKVDMVTVDMGAPILKADQVPVRSDKDQEIDEKITDLSRKYFSLPEDVPVTTYDGRAYLQAVDEKYDVIMVDAYQDITIPFQMSSVEFFNMVKDHLTENGVMVVNMNMRGSGEGNINQYLADTIASVFGTVYTADVKGSTNRELFASNQEDMLDTLKNNAGNLANADLQNMMLAVADTSTQYDGGDYIMTDDKAPVELLGMQVIDQVIKEEVAYYKGIYEEQGLDGLLQSL